jgi:hypothetical protein
MSLISVLDLENEYRKYYFIDDFEAMEVNWAVYIGASRDDGIPPLWLRNIGPPSMTKTTTTSPMSASPYTVMCSNITHATLTTGHKMGKPLLPKLKGKVLVVNDFSNIQSQQTDHKAEIYAQLRAAYDGEWTFLYGGEVPEITGCGFFGIIVCATRSVESDSIQTIRLGERWLDVRSRNTNRIAKAQAAMAHCGGEAIFSKTLKDMTGRFLKEKWENPITVSNLSADQTKDIINLAEFVARARTPMMRDRELRQITQVPDPEGPMRLCKQLKRLVGCIAEIRDKTVIDTPEMDTVRRVAFDCIIPERKMVLDAIKTDSSGLTSTQISMTVGLHRSVTSRLVEELELVGLVTTEGCEPWGKRFKLSDMSKEVLRPTINQPVLFSMDGTDDFTERVEKAKSMLSQGRSIEEVSETVGYVVAEHCLEKGILPALERAPKPEDNGVSL